MAFSRSDLRRLVLLVLLGAACKDVITATAKEPLLEASLSLRADFGPELVFAETHLIPGDSLILHARVEGNPSAYAVPVTTAATPGMVTSRPDGSVQVHGPGDLRLTVTAAAKSPSTSPQTLSAWAKLAVACTMDARPGLSVILVDSLSGIAPSGPGGVRFRATGAAWADSLSVPAMIASWATAWERRGTVSLSVHADGYAPWRRDGIEVTGGICHVRKTEVTARLQRP